MASFTLARSFFVLILAFVAFFSRISICEAYSSFYFTSLGKNTSFASEDIALYGDAKLVDGGSSIQLRGDSVSEGGGRVVYKKPIEYVQKNFQSPAGFSTVFSFSMSRNQSGSLGFVVFPANGSFDHSSFQVKFDLSRNFTKFRDSNITVSVNGVTKKKEKFTIANLDNKERSLLYACIIYHPYHSSLEVLFGGSETSFHHLVFSWVDWSETMKINDSFILGVKSYSGNFSLCSWSLEPRPAPEHSMVPILEELRENEEAAAKRRRREKTRKIVTGFALTFGSIGLVFFAMMHIWAAFKRNNLRSEDYGLKGKEFECDKIEKTEAAMSKPQGN